MNVFIELIGVSIHFNFIENILHQSLTVTQFPQCIECCFKGSFRPNNPLTNATLMGKMGIQPILLVTMPVKKIKGVASQQ